MLARSYAPISRDAAGFIVTIEQSHREHLSVETQIGQLVQCPNCGKTVVVNGSYCPACGTRFGVRPGGFWIRVGAYLIDGMVLLIPGLLLRVSVVALYGPVSTTVATYDVYGHAHLSISYHMDALLTSMVLGFVLDVLYFGYFWTTSGSSLGMRACGLRVRDKVTGNAISWGQAAGRFLMIMVGFACIGLGVMSVGWDAEKRGWHDRAAGTEVVRIRS